VRLDVPIYVAETVMDRAGIMPDEEVESEIAPTMPGSEGGSSERLSLLRTLLSRLIWTIWKPTTTKTTTINAIITGDLCGPEAGQLFESGPSF